MEARGFLRLIGRPQLDWDGRTHPLPVERRNQLVAYLALRRTWVGRTELAELLWPDQPSRLSHANLRKTVFRLQSLPWGERLESQANALRFLVPTDVEQLASLAPADIAQWPAGELLEGYEEAGECWMQWLAFERERTRGARRAAMLTALERADGAQAVALTSQLLAADPTDESALVAHMRALAAAGQGAKARAAYREFELRLADEFGLLPGAAAKAAHDALGVVHEAVSAPPPTAKPARDEGFVGRAAELRQLHDWFAAGKERAACIVGPGGAGKTRLALQALRELAPGFGGYARLVRFEDTAADTDIAMHMAAALGVPMNGSKEPLVQLAQALGGGAQLLVLDNLEHLPHASGVLQDLLRRCAGLRFIATSRVRLPLEGAALLPLDGLPCPDPEDADRLDGFDAVQLFAAAARRVEPAFNPAIESASVVEICRQVDGLPLALEIAAAWTRVLSCAAIAAELRQGGELLQAADSSRPARHAGMDVVFAQSWSLLSPAERDALARLSVFRGGFTPAAARAVAGASLPVLGALADKSLLRKEGTRLHIHPLLQQLAAARLPAGGPSEEVEAAHARHFHHLMAQLQRGAKGGHRDALTQLDAELENCRKAWAWAVEHGERDLAGRSVGALRDYHDHRGRWAEGLALFRPAIASPKVQSVVAHLEYRLDRFAEAIANANQAWESAGPGADVETLLQCFKVLAASHMRLGRHGEARRFFGEALRIAPQSGDPRTEPVLMDNLALIEKYEGHFDESLKMSLAALARFREIGDVAAEALCLNNIASLEGELGRTQAAIQHLKESLVLCDRFDLANTRNFVLANLAEQSIPAGDLDGAARYGELALQASRATGSRSVEGAVHVHLSALALARGDEDGARKELQAGLGIAVALQYPWLLAGGVLQFADLLAARGSDGEAAVLRQWTLAQSALTQGQRRETERKLPQPAPAVPAALSAMSLADLGSRIALETDVGYAPLLAQLAPA